MSPLFVSALLVAALTAPPAHAADPAATVNSLVAAGKGEKARLKCDSWFATDPATAPEVREACAQAYLELAAAADTAAAWTKFRGDFAGTDVADGVKSKEAAAAMREAGTDAPAQTYLDLAYKYAGTEFATEANALALVAAFRDVQTDADALEAVNRYPTAPEARPVLLRHLDAFVIFELPPNEAVASFRSVVLIDGEPDPELHWVATEDGAAWRVWKDAVKAAAEAAHVPAALVDAHAQVPFGFEGEIPAVELEADGRKTVRRRLPEFELCWDPVAAKGLAVEARLGEGRAHYKVPWPEGCGPTSDGALLVHEGGQVAGLVVGESWIDLRGGPAVAAAPIVEVPVPGGRGIPGRTATTLPGLPLGATLATTELRVAQDGIWARTGGGWLVTTPAGHRWFTTAALPETAPVLDTTWGRPASEGWAAQVTAAAEAAKAATLAAPPAAPSGAATMSPLLAEILGWRDLGAVPVQDRIAGRLGLDAGWQLSGAVDIAPRPPAGARPVSARPGSVPDGLGALLGVDGLTVGSATSLDLDGDPGVETVVLASASAGGAPVGLVLVVDPGESETRIFPFSVDGAGTREAPFAFEKDGVRYVAWTGRTTGEVTFPFLELVRVDGAGGFVLDTLVRPYAFQ